MEVPKDRNYKIEEILEIIDTQENKMTLQCEFNIQELKKEFKDDNDINFNNKNSYDFQGDKEDLLSLGSNKFGISIDKEKEFDNFDKSKN